MFKKWCLYIILTIPSIVYCLSNPVHIKRACLDRVTKTLTVDYIASTDACGSFTEYVVYGRESAIQPFIKLHTHLVLNSGMFSFVLPNNKNWEIYISSRFACNGTDTLNSNIVIVDDTPPGLLNIDSVSVNLYTQKLYAGWSKATEIDVKGYTLFKVDAITGTNSVIKTLNNTIDSFNILTFNTSNNGNKLAIAVFDSCNNEGIISNAHSPVFLQYNSLIYNDLCDKKLRIEWTPYTAPNWLVSSYDIYAGLSINSLTLIQNVPAITNSFDIDIITPGQTHLVYIRARNNNGFTSTSNLIFIKTQSNPKNIQLDLGHVTYKSKGINEISVKYNSTIKDSINSIRLLSRKQGDVSWTQVFNAKPSTSLFYVDHTCANENYIYEYISAATNTCNDTFASTSVYPSILLNKNGFVFTWNNNVTWNLKDNKFIQYNNTDNIINQTSNNTYSTVLTQPSIWTKYQVKVYKKNISNNILDSSISNPQIHLVFDTTLVPNVFHPRGTLNNVFKITNPNVKSGQSKMIVLNRYGQKIFQGDALEGWDGKYQNDNVSCGTYIYKIIIDRKDIEKQETLQGVIHIIE